MYNRSLELSVGIFVLIGLLCVGWLTIRLGRMEILGEDHYKVSARFSSVAGLKNGAQVQMAGVDIGRVEKIELDTQDLVARVVLRIRESVPLDDEVMASVKTSGLIGDKYIEITPGGGLEQLEDGDKILSTESSVNIEDMIGKYAFGSVDE